MTGNEQLKRRKTLAEIITITAVVAFVGYIFWGIAIIFWNHYKDHFSCYDNQRKIADSMIVYAQDHNEIFPAKETVWNDIKIETNILLIDPSIKNRRRHGPTNDYAYNAQMDKKHLGDILNPERIFLTCDSDNPNHLWYSSADSALRHDGKCKFSFADGHVELYDGNYPSACKIKVHIHPELNRDNDKNRLLTFTGKDSVQKTMDFTKYDFDSVGSNAFMPELVTYNHEITWEGFMKIDKTGIYKFKCTSDNTLFLDINNNTESKRLIEMVHGGSAKGSIKLTAGKYYYFQLLYKKIKDTGKISIRWIPPEGKESRIPASVFYTAFDAMTSN